MIQPPAVPEILLATPAGMPGDNEPLVPSVIRRCTRCGRDCYVSTGLIGERPGARVVCIPCFRPSEVTEFQITDAQIVEVNRANGTSYTGPELIRMAKAALCRGKK